jgi:hypothetical protein
MEEIVKCRNEGKKKKKWGKKNCEGDGDGDGGSRG